MMKQSFISFLILVVILTQPGYSQQSASSLGWDLTYSFVLERNNVARNNWIWKWLEFGTQETDTRRQSIAQKWIVEWQGEPIISSILIESPAFHAAEHTTDWFVRTENKAFYWRLIEGVSKSETEKKYFTPQTYDELFGEVSLWQQFTPRKAQDLPPQTSTDEKDFLTGYIGFISTYEKGKSRQSLLTMEDFIICSGMKCTPESRELKPGRLLNAIVSIPGDPRCWVKEYKPKSPAELTAMNPRQLVDELIKSSYAPYDMQERFDYLSLIEKEIRQSGFEVLPVLTEYANDNAAQSDSECDKARFFNAKQIAVNIDEFKLRLRGTKEGRETIAAFERAIERMEQKKEKTKTYGNLDLKPLKGVNSFDESIQETFRVKKKIKMSESELLKFSNFLTARHPAYPSWSDKELFKDYSQVNESGNPAQVYILKKPERFYEEYAEFKKIRS